MSDYNLNGNKCRPQVQPDASYWNACHVLRSVTINEVLGELNKTEPLPAYYADGSKEESDELDLLIQLAKNRYEQNHFFDKYTAGNFSIQTTLSPFLVDPEYTKSPPPGSFFNDRKPDHQPLLKNGGELSRLFESEIPGYWHRHVLNVICDKQIPAKNCEDQTVRLVRLREIISPPKKALISAALEIAISSALMAAWHFKWLHDPGKIARRRRPYEANNSFVTEYDCVPEIVSGDVRSGDRKTDIKESPGTPRHPAYPSGHSTYSAAASTVLACLFPKYAKEFNSLANNIGHARLWAGVHWLSDHTAGQRVGEAVGQAVISQLNASGIVPSLQPVINPPSIDQLRHDRDEYFKHCGNADQNNFCNGITKVDFTNKDNLLEVPLEGV